MQESQSYFKYTKERIEKKINKEEEIKLRKKLFTSQLELIEKAYFPADKLTMNPETHKKLNKFYGIDSFKCEINKDSKTLKCIIVKYKEFFCSYFHGGENRDGDPISGYSTGYEIKELRIYNNKVYNNGYYVHKYEFADAMNRDKYEAEKQMQDIYEKVKQHINDIFGIKTYAQKHAERFKKRIL